MTLIGSSRRCEVRLQDGSVSMVHASLVLTPRGLWIVDLMGRGGVAVDGRRGSWKEVHLGSMIQIGRFQLRVRFGRSQNDDVARDVQQPSTPGHTITPKSNLAASGGISEQTVLVLVKQMTNMQTRFMEHSQRQTQLINCLLAQLERSQQMPIHRDSMSIRRELDEIKTHLVHVQDLAAVPEGWP